MKDDLDDLGDDSFLNTLRWLFRGTVMALVMVLLLLLKPLVSLYWWVFGRR